MSNPSPAVVRHIISTHAPRLLETMDALKEKFNAKLVALTVPATGLVLGNQSVHSADAVERDFVPWIPNTDTVAEARAWAETKARSRAEQARNRPGRAAKR